MALWLGRLTRRSQDQLLPSLLDEFVFSASKFNFSTLPKVAKFLPADSWGSHSYIVHMKLLFAFFLQWHALKQAI